MSYYSKAISRCATIAFLACVIGLVAGSSPPAIARAALPSCGLSTGKHASSFADFVNKIVVTDDDTASRRILGFTKVASATWVTDEAKCQRAITRMDANYWTAPRGGPIYLMQVGTDYAGFPGDTHSAGNPMILHFNSNFNVITTGVW